MILTGLDRLLADEKALAGRRYGLLVHGASVSAGLVPAHLALTAAAESPALLFGPEHGLYGIEQDMVSSADQLDPWTGLQVASLYGDTESSLRADRSHFRDLDLLVIDLQDVGARYYTYAATAVWAAEVALREGCEVWVLDRPNPIGGLVVEGNLRQAGFESFVGAFELPVRHGLTLGELISLEAARRSWPDGLRVWTMHGWLRTMLWSETDRLWMAPSPNIPTLQTALVYPGLCLLEGTELSEGRGTTRPFELVGAPGVDAPGQRAQQPWALGCENRPHLLSTRVPQTRGRGLWWGRDQGDGSVVVRTRALRSRDPLRFPTGRTGGLRLA